MKKQLIILSAVFACSSMSFADYTRGGTSKQTSGSTHSSGTSSLPTRDNSDAVYDSTVGGSPSRQDANRDMNKKSRQSRSTLGEAQTELDRPVGTDSSGHKTDQSTTTQGTRE